MCDYTRHAGEEFKRDFLGLSQCPPLFNAIDKLDKIQIYFKCSGTIMKKKVLPVICSNCVTYLMKRCET